MENSASLAKFEGIGRRPAGSYGHHLVSSRYDTDYARRETPRRQLEPLSQEEATTIGMQFIAAAGGNDAAVGQLYAYLVRNGIIDERAWSA
jgi:hypothetical protein